LQASLSLEALERAARGRTQLPVSGTRIDTHSSERFLHAEDLAPGHRFEHRERALIRFGVEVGDDPDARGGELLGGEARRELHQ
jgi:hypothetical protein